MTKITEEEFLKDVANHRLQIRMDEGVHRHLYLSQPGTNNMSFAIITWPGHLCYTGDMGTFVFSRMIDMLNFFRGEPTGPLKRNLGYWAEKLLAVDKTDNYREFDVDFFRENVKEHIQNQLDVDSWEAVPEDVREDDDVVSLLEADDEWDCISQIRLFHQAKVDFTDFFDGNQTHQPTGRYEWACYAIPWAIRLYDAAPKPPQFFSYDPEQLEFHTHATEDQAKAEAQKAIDEATEARDEVGRDADFTPLDKRICYGVVRGMAVVVPDPIDNNFEHLKLREILP